MAPSEEPFLDMEAEETRHVRKLKRENNIIKIGAAALLLAGGCVCSYSQGRTPITNVVEDVERLPAIPVKTDNLVSDDGVEIPKYFDTRSEWLGCGTFVVDQGQCGDCWAASAANVFGDRVCIHLQESGEAIPLPHAGAGGSGTMARMFQQAGKCIGNGTMGMAHEHGCKRGAFFVSPQPLVSCASANNTEPPTYGQYPDGKYKPGRTLYPSSTGCNGGESNDAWRYIYHEGLSSMNSEQTSGCSPYTSNECSFTDPRNNGCHTCDFSICDDTGLKPDVYRADSFGWIMEEDLPERGSWDPIEETFGKKGTEKHRPLSEKPAMDRQVRKMQIEMMTNGPLHTCIDDFANFGLFFNEHPMGIYNSTDGSPNTGGHCIELMGWGTDKATGMPYWTWKNSWGKNFANGGYARFIRGVDLLGIESDVWVGCPANSNCKLTAGVVQNQSWVPKSAYYPVAPGYRNPTPEPKPTPPPRHPTSASQPSRSWPGGKETELTREQFSHSTVAPLVMAAVRQTLGGGLTDEAALAKAKRVWTRSVRGLRIRVEVEGVGKHATSIRHMEGHTQVL